MKELDTILEHLKSQEEVDAVFITGSTATGENKEYSDLDLVIIVNENTHAIRSVYEWIDGLFSDIFIFEKKDLQRIEEATELSANGMDAIFVTWLGKATISFDKSGTTTRLLNAVPALTAKMHIPLSEKEDVWRRINHNFVNNTRYLASNEPVYLEALEIRLQNSVTELLLGFLTLNTEPWRGEKHAVKYISQTDPVFYQSYKAFLNANTVQARFEIYKKMLESLVTVDRPLWRQGDLDIVSSDPKTTFSKEDLAMYWKRLTRE
jgi:predicted nucleotidyltransferase